MTQIDFNSKFQKEFDNLNVQQKKAASIIHGPVMVIAGPGTGKTQILSTRIGHILSTTDTKPNEILCLTFTDAGANAIRTRLNEIIGSTAMDVNIYTFHSFCNMLMNRYPEEFNQKGSTLIDELDRRIILRDLMENVPYNTPIKKRFTSLDKAIGIIDANFKTFKSENYNIDKLLKLLEEEIVTEKSNSAYYYKINSGDNKKGDLKQNDWDKYLNKNEKTKQLAQLYLLYIQVLKEKNFIELSDLILQIVEVLKSNDSIRMDCQETFQVLMIDEFQDTNGAQMDIINELCRDVEDPNIMVVGDDDQSIYRFQGANLDNIYSFYENFLQDKPTSVQAERIIILDQNYRSSQRILDVAKSLIDNNKQRIINIIESLPLSKNLLASNTEIATNNTPVQVLEHIYKEHEFISIAKRIEHLKNNHVNLNTIAVLIPKNNDIIEFSNYLEILKIPYELSKSYNILEKPFIINLLHVFQYIQMDKYHPNDVNDIFITSLFFPWNNIDIVIIADFLARFKIEKNSNRDLQLKNFIVLEDEKSPIKAVFAHYNTLISKENQLSFLEFYHLVIDTFQIKTWILNQSNRLELLQEMKTLERFIKEQLAAKDAFQLVEFIQLIENYNIESIPILLVNQIKQNNSIKLMTLHGSKGLEFDHVFILNQIYTKNNNNSYNIYLPENFKNTHISMTKHTDDSSEIEENRRLFYVGITRAKTNLTISYYTLEPSTKDKPKAKIISPFINELQAKEIEKIDVSEIEKTAVQLSKIEVSEEDYLEFESIELSKLKENCHLNFENKYIEQLIDNMSMSVSNINIYLECPRKFYFESLLSVPGSSQENLIIGNIFHKAIEHFNKKTIEEKKIPSIDFLIELAVKELFFNQKLISENKYTTLKDYLKQEIEKYYNHYAATWTINIESEKKLTGSYRSIPLIGYVDKIIYHTPNTIDIVDYKTGKMSNAKTKFSPPVDSSEYKVPSNPTKEELYGGDYWRQAVFYKILMQSMNSSNIIENIKFDFIFTEDGKHCSQDILVTNEDMAIVGSQIVEVYQKIKDKKFEGCNEASCTWCQLTTANH